MIFRGVFMKVLSIPDYILYNQALSSNDKIIIAYLLAYGSQVVIVSTGKISKSLNIPVRTVFRSLDVLERLELIKVDTDKSLNGSYKSRKITLLNPNFKLHHYLLNINNGDITKL